MIRAAIAASISVALLAGCGGRPLPAGTFRGERGLTVNPGTDPVVAGGLRRIELKIRDDGAATLVDGGVPWEGHVTTDDDILNFEVYAVNGINIAKQPGDLPRNLVVYFLPGGALKYGGVVLTRG